MKFIPAPLLAHYASGNLKVAHALVITRQDGTVYGFTSAAEGVAAGVISGLPALSATVGLDVTGVKTTNTLSVDNMELTTFDDGSVFTQDDILCGRWTSARFSLRRYCWENPSWGSEVLLTGHLGEIQVKGATITVELRGLQQKLQQAVGPITSKTCRAVFNSTPCSASHVNRVVPSVAVTTVGSQTSLYFMVLDDYYIYPYDWFTNGVIRFLSGPNIGLSATIRGFNYGTITLDFPMHFTVSPGELVHLTAGCKKTLEECRVKWNNVLNFQGEPHIPGIDKQTRSAV